MIAAPGVPAADSRLRTTLAWRITASCLLVAVLATGVAGVIAGRLLSTAAREVTQEFLADQADVIAAQRTESDGLGISQIADVLRGQGIRVVLVGPDGRLSATDPLARTAAGRAGAAEVLDGRTVSAAPTVNGQLVVVEARPGPTGGFALVQRVDEAAVGRPRRAFVPALLIGGLVAVVVGVIGAALLARPLRRTAAVARTMGAGRRDARIPVHGPQEIADVALAVNELADALERSEDRQRRFLLSVSHELRTPLTAVAGFAESLADGVVTGNDVPAAGRTIQREAARLHRLVDDLMELARLEADDFRLDPVPVDLVALLDEAAQVWAARCRDAGVRFRLDASAEPGHPHQAGFEHPAHRVPTMVHADPRRLRQILDGLAENALRVTPPEAELVFALRTEPGHAVLEIRDGGPGLSADDHAVVFDRGALHERYRDRWPVGAGGIGLALVYGLVIRMGATITSGDAPEGGASFTVRLPR